MHKYNIEFIASMAANAALWGFVVYCVFFR